MIANILLTILVTTLLAMAWAPFLIKFLYEKKIIKNAKLNFALIAGESEVKAGTPIMGGILVVVTVVVLNLILNRDSFTYTALIVFTLSALLGGFDDWLNIFGRQRIIRPISKHLLLIKVHKSFLMKIYLAIKTPWNIYKNFWYMLGSNPGTGIHAGEKIIVQFLAGGILAYSLYSGDGVHSLWIPAFGSLNISWLFVPFVIATIISVANAVNITDGLDGLGSGTLIASFLAFLIIALDKGEDSVAMLIAIVLGALIAYLYFNIKPARFHFGDIGTLSLGTLLATVAIYLDVAILLPIIGFVFVAEISSSLLQGIYKMIYQKRLFKMAPLHLHYQILGWSEEKIVMRFWLFSFFFSILGLWIYFAFK